VGTAGGPPGDVAIVAAQPLILDDLALLDETTRGRGGVPVEESTTSTCLGGSDSTACQCRVLPRERVLPGQ
jgi:hypothetical protein